MVAPRTAQRILLASASLQLARAARIAVEVEEHVQVNSTLAAFTPDNAFEEAIRTEEHAMEESIRAEERVDATCAEAVSQSKQEGEGRCKCVTGSFVFGTSEACNSHQEIDDFLPEEYAGHGCSCEDESFTSCGHIVQGSVVHNGLGDICSCPSGGFVMGDGAHCDPASRTRTFNPSNYEGCHCSWNYDQTRNMQEHLQSFWADLLVTENPRGIEPRCHPYIEGEDRRGVVLLMHGATACAGWWYLVKPPLVADGWMVVATTHIGHGRAPLIRRGEQWEVTDFTADMPTRGEAFIDYANELNNAMKKYRRDNPDKEMVIIGHSIGGALSTHMAMVMPTLWNRLLLLNPFFSPGALPAHLDFSILRAVTGIVLPAAHYFRSTESLRWSEGCDAIRLEPNGGHGGMCQFSLLHLRAWLELGRYVQGEVESIASAHGVFTGGITSRIWGVGHWATSRVLGRELMTSGVQTQILAAVGDGAVQNANLHFLISAFHAWATGGNSFCNFPAEFTHNFIAPIDYPWIDHWWLDRGRVAGGRTVIDHMVAFARDGTQVPVNGRLSLSQDDGVFALQDNSDGRCDVLPAR